MNIRDVIVTLKGKRLMVQAGGGTGVQIFILKDDAPTPSEYAEITEVGDDYFVVEHVQRDQQRHVTTYSIAALVSIMNLNLLPVRG